MQNLEKVVEPDQWTALSPRLQERLKIKESYVALNCILNTLDSELVGTYCRFFKFLPNEIPERFT